MENKENLPAVQTKLPELVKDLNPIQRGWLQMAIKREETFAALEKGQLEIKSKLTVAYDFFAFSETDTVEQLEKKLTDGQAAFAEAKNMTDILVERRKHFTGTIKEKVIDKAMEFEKNCQNEIEKVSPAEFQLRKAYNERKGEKDAKQKELQMLEAHIKNEHFRLGEEYRLALKTMGLDAYAKALKEKQPLDRIDAYKKAIAGFMREIPLGKFIRYERKYVTDAEAKKLNDSIPKYNNAEDLKIAIDGLDEIFIMYEQDLKNAKKAIAATEKEKETAIAKSEELVDTETAANDLIGSTGSVSYSGGKKTEVKEKMEVVSENSDEYAKAVISAFLKNWSAARPKLQAQSWDNVKISQLAAALGKVATEKPGTKFEGLTLKKVEK